MRGHVVVAKQQREMNNIGRNFEREVASMYRALGAEVQHDVGIAGNQIDIVIKENTTSGRTVTTIVECKAYQRPVGIDQVNALSGLFYLLKSRGQADAAALVSQAGFTRAAREAGRAHGLELIEIAELQKRVSGLGKAVEAARKEIQEQENGSEQRSKAPPRIFVATPFSREFNDVYLLGKCDVAKKLNCIVEGIDEIEHNGYILDDPSE